jgi:formylglycine-generating enzyme required for sulfatase activity
MRKPFIELFTPPVGAAAVLLILSTCQPPVNPQDLLRAGDTIKPTITISSHQEGDPFAEPNTTITGTVVDPAKYDGTAGLLVSSTWAVQGSTTGGTLTLGSGGAFSVGVDTLSRAIELVLVITATDWNNNTESLRLSLAVPKEITSFVFETAHNQHLPFDAVGAISGTAIEVALATGTIRTALVSTFTHTGTSVVVDVAEQQTGVTVHDFSSPVVYSVTGRDGRVKDYTVTIKDVSANHGQAAVPTFNQAAGTYDHDILVSVSTGTPGGVIYYTINEQDPTSSSNRYTVPVSVAGHGTILALRAVVYAPGYTPSEIASRTYTISYTIPAAPSGLGATALSSTSIRLAWIDNSPIETGFKVDRSTDGSDWALVFLTAANATTWEDSGRSADTGYYYRVRATNAGADSAFTNTAYTSTFFTDLVRISAASDSFTMGDGTVGPNVTQSISYSYYLTECEITNTLFAAFIADAGYTTQSYWTTYGWTWKSGITEPCYWTDILYNGANQPVVGVSWYEAVAYCNWRSAKDGLTPAYDSSGLANLTATGYRLPTEVEWEYAAAKGAIGQAERKFAYGGSGADPLETGRVVCSVSPAIAGRPADVGSKSTGDPLTTGDTPQGLCDMSGNVWEWCSDNWQANASVSSAMDRYYFAGAGDLSRFVFRGGSWSDTSSTNVRCAVRYDQYASARNDYTRGFRLCRP